jgi:hypothetical protein
MENKPKPSGGTPTSSGSTTPEVTISRQQAALTPRRPDPEPANVAGTESPLPLESNLPNRPFRFTKTETHSQVIELVHLPALSGSEEEGLSDLAQQVRPQLVEAGVIRPPEDQPLEVVPQATGFLAVLTRLSTVLLKLFKMFTSWLDI